MNFLTLESISKNINGNKILNNIKLDIKNGEFLVLLGSSGCGKTTLLRILSGLEENFTGKIYLENNDITNMSPCKRNFGMVFQSYALFPNMTVEKNIMYGLKNRKYNKKYIKEKIDDILQMMNMEHYKNKFPYQLSGGQQQRVALARALVVSPKILFLDEPLSALDYNIRVNIRKQIKDIQKRLKITMIMVTHDQEEAMVMADRIAIMNNGEIVQIGTPEEIYRKPKNQYIAKFIGDLNVIKYKQNEVKLTRPEDIKYSFEYKDGYEEAFIKDIEFRGAFYRLNLNSEKLSGDIKLNVSNDNKCKINKNNKIYIRTSNFLDII